MSDRHRTTYERALVGYDEEFQRALVAEIITAIGMASVVKDAPIMAIRTGETIEALTQCLITTAALCPDFDTPSRLREFAEQLAKRIRRSVAAARADPPPDAESIFGFRKGGRA